MDLANVTLTQLRYVVAVDRFRSFRLAAKHCHVSQPALSMQLGKLEELLDLVVFDRSRQPVVPTARGAAVVAQARAILHETERLAEVAQGETEIAGRYRLGIIPSLAPTLVPRFLPAFSREYPKVELVVEEVQTDAMLRRLQDDSLDGGVAVTPLGAAGVHEQELFREPLYAYLPPRHALGKRARVRQSDLVDEQVWLMAEGHCFRTQVLHLCRVSQESERRGARFESGSFETLVRLVDAGQGVTVLPELVVQGLALPHQKKRVRPFAAPVPVRQVSFVHAREHLHRAIAGALISALKHATRGVGGAGRTPSIIVPVTDTPD